MIPIPSEQRHSPSAVLTELKGPMNSSTTFQSSAVTASLAANGRLLLKPSKSVVGASRLVKVENASDALPTVQQILLR